MKQELHSKQELRRQYKLKRRSMPMHEVTEASERISARFLALQEYQTCDSIMFYISTDHEADTRELLMWALADGKQVAAPKVYGDYMKFHRITDLKELTPGAYGILEPEGGEELLPKKDDILLVPGIVFDETGGRIGYGGGYYDRYIECHEEALAVALAYDWQVLKKIPCESFDKKPDMILTPSKTLDLRTKRNVIQE